MSKALKSYVLAKIMQYVPTNGLKEDIYNIDIQQGSYPEYIMNLCKSIRKNKKRKNSKKVDKKRKTTKKNI